MEEEQKKKTQIPKYKVFVMPQEFRAKPAKGNTNMIIVVLSIFLVLVVGGAVAFVMLRKQPAKIVQAPSTATKPVVTPKIEEPNKEEKPKQESKLPKEEPKVEEAQTQLPPIFGDIFSTSRDTDQDGLTDLEETLYGTSSAKPDSDGDGHIDTSELINLYNPAGVAPADLKDAVTIATYTNETYKYSLLYPKEWSSRALTKNKSKVIFSADTGEYIQVSAFENKEQASVLDWYLTQSPDISPSQVDAVTFKSGLKGIKTIDGLTYVLVKPLSATIVPSNEKHYLYVINYNPGTKIELNFKTTFQMMINSFVVQSAEKTQ